MCLRVVVLCICSTLAFASNRLTTLSVTSTFANLDAAGQITDIQDDGRGTYYDGTDGVTTFLTSNGYNGQVYGDWQFSTLSSTVRKVSISFVNAIQPSAGGTAIPSPPFSMKDVIAHVEDKCTQIANGSGGWNNMLHMSAGQSFQCPIILHFYDSDGSEYRVYMGPNWEPETTYAKVTCNTVAADNSGCNDWYIDPIPVNGMPGKALGRLIYFTKRSSVNEGDYYFGFHFHLTRP